MFHIIEFKGMKEVAVVPHSWMTSTQTCLWPPVKSPSKLAKMVKGKTVPEENWLQYEIRSMGEFNTYEEARKRLKKAEEFSDLQSDVDAGRERKKRTLSSSDCEDSDEESPSLLPKAPHIPKPIYSKDSAPSTSNTPSYFSRHITPSNLLNVTHAHRTTQFTSQPQNTFDTHYLEQPFTQQIHAAPIQTDRSNTQTPLQNCACSKLHLQILKNIEKELKAHTDILQTHTNMPTQLLNPSSDSSFKLSNVLPSNFKIGLPVKSIEDLKMMEDYLKDNVNFSQMLPYLAAVGGDGVKRVLQRLLPKLLDNSLCISLNWKGREDKHGFQQYERILGLIYQAVKYHCKTVTLEDINSFIKNWLRFAPDRNGGRKSRQNVNELF